MQEGHAPGNGDSPQLSCHPVARMLVVPQADAEEAAQTMVRLDIPYSDWDNDDELLRHLGGGLTPQDLESLRGRLAIWNLEDPELDPHHTALRLRTEGGVRASAVHGVGYMGHFRAMSGEGPEQSNQVVDGMAVNEGDPVIAVVDSSIVDRASRPEWMNEPAVYAETQDEEAASDEYAIPASHGTFVVSLIRQQSSKPVWFAAAKPRLTGDHLHDGWLGEEPTTELHVAAALDRLRSRITNANREVAALNLSVGAHSDSPCQDDFLMSVKLALAAWRAAFPGTPVYAAGGNSMDPNPVYPGAFEAITAVAALDQGGRETVWATPNAAGRRNGSGRHWIDKRFLGVGCVGLSGDSECPYIIWGGSSFATALHTAANA